MSRPAGLMVPGPGQWASKDFLYRRLGSDVIGILRFAVAVMLLAASVGTSFAQGDKPQLKRPDNLSDEEDKPKEKPKPKVKGPRAVGLLQLSSSGKGTLVPIAILIDGRFYDGSVYKADPVPMALESGTVYEVMQTGDSEGLFTVSGALRNKTPGSARPWLGTGVYLPRGTEEAKTTRKAENVPVGLDNSDDPPRLTRSEASKAAKDSGASSAPAPSAGTGTTAKPEAAPASPAQASANQNSSASQKADPKSEEEYRPTLRRGKPTQAQEEEAKKPEPEVKSSVALQVVPAISDAGGPEPRSFKFFWKTGEETERRDQMLALAAEEVRAYVSEQAKNSTAVQPSPKKTARKAPSKPQQPTFENVQFHAFDVWVNNQPIMILSATARLPRAAGAAGLPEPLSITLVAKTDIYGNLRKLYSGVTDKFHLDVTPRLELIDAVDADGDGRGELLFRETADVGNGYVIYRATADKLWKLFDTVNQ